jgi:hypothetical protein
MTIIIFYFFLLPTWIDGFQNIKGILVRHGILSSSEGEKFSAKNLSSEGENTTTYYKDCDIDGFHKNTTTYYKVALQQAQCDIDGSYHIHLLLKLILPLLLVLGGFIWVTLKFRIPGVSRSVECAKQKKQEEYLDHIQDKILDFLNNYNGVIITVIGFIIGLLGGFLVSSGLNNFYFFLGFETIVLSLISSLLAYPSFIRFSFIHKIKAEKRDNENGSGTPILKHYFRIACFASVSLILGLVMLVTGLE